MVKMMSYDENIKKSKNFEKSIFSFFVPMALGKPPGRPGAGTKENIYILYEKKHENESCAVGQALFRADIGGPDGKKPVKIAPAGPGR